MKLNYFSAGLLLVLSFSLGTCNEAKTSQNASPFPTPISSIAQLQKIGYDPAYPLEGQYLLTQDIDAADTQNWNQGRGFAPIGNYELRGEEEDLSLAFTGSLDGQGHVITGLHINRPTDKDVGLFKAIGKSGKITRLGLEDSTIVGSIFVGALTGHNVGAISHCYATGTVSGNMGIGGLVGDNNGKVLRSHSTTNTASDFGMSGGLAGRNYGSISHCSTTGLVSGTKSVGGLVGVNIENATITHCHATGRITGGAGGSINGCFTGGLVGSNHGMIAASYATGRVTGNADVGGLVGYADNSVITECYARGTVSGHEDIGGLVGTFSDSTIKKCCATGAVSGDENVGGFSGSTYDGTIKQCCATGNVFGDDGIGGFVGLAAGFLFENNYALGAVSGNKNVGGFAGKNEGFITRCYTTGDVAGDENVGGFIGKNSDSVITCYATGGVSGNENVGGLIGENEAAFAANCYATGAVSGRTTIGKSIGKKHRSEPCLSWEKAGDDEWEEPTFNFGKCVHTPEAPPTALLFLSANSQTLLAWFTNIGWGLDQPSRDEPAWCIIDKLHQPLFRDSYYTEEVFSIKLRAKHGHVQAEPAQAVYARNASVLLTATPKPGYVFAGWIGQGLGSSVALDLNPLPLLMHANREVTAIFLPDAPILISRIADLQKIGNDPAWPLDGHYHLTQDIDATETQKWNRRAGFVPIGTPGHPFRGYFDGQGHVIANLHIKRPYQRYVGLFGVTGKDAVISQVGIKNGTISGLGDTGGLVGENYGTIRESYATCSVSSRLSAGGLVGGNGGMIKKSYATGPVSGTERQGVTAGGLAATNHHQATIQDSYATGDVYGRGPQVGRLLGCNYYDGNTLSNNYATGRVSGRGTVDRLVGTSIWCSNSDAAFAEGIYPAVAMLLLLTLCLINTVLCLVSIPARWWKRRRQRHNETYAALKSSG